jgi:hypothetical protein
VTHTREATPATTMLRELAQLLVRENLSVADVMTRVGTVTSEPCDLMVPITLHPSLPGIRKAKVARYPDSGLPYFLSLEFAADAMPTVTEFVAAFGAWKVLRHDLGAPVPLCFDHVSGGSTWTIALIADLPPATVPMDATPIPRCVLRREPA